MNGLTRAGGKRMQVMPDGTLTVTTGSLIRVQTFSQEYEVGIAKDVKPGGTAEV